MEPIPSKPHASKNLAISLFVLVAVVLVGVYWYRYEHTKSLAPSASNPRPLSAEEQATLVGKDDNNVQNPIVVNEQTQIVTESKTSPKPVFTQEQQAQIIQ